MPKNFTPSMAVLGAALVAALLAPPAQAATCQVTASGAGSQDGSSWANAATLQGALGNASCTEIWVKAGVYKPTTSADRTISFNVNAGVAVYGGFAGTETLRSQANPATHRTVLSGDIDGNDANTGGVTLTAADIAGANSYHVVVMGGTGNVGNAAIGASTVLDGLTVTAGKADGSTGNDDVGGGLLCNGNHGPDPNIFCSPTLSRLTFSGNHAMYGGAIYNCVNASPTIIQGNFSGNRAVEGGGAIGNYGQSGNASPAISHSTFSGNHAKFGGAIYNTTNISGTSSPAISHSTFQGNSASGNGGAVHNSFNFGSNDPVFRFVTFSGNSAGLSGGAIYTSKGHPTVEYSILWGNTAGSGPQTWTMYTGGLTQLTDSLIEGGCPSADVSTGGSTTCTGVFTNHPQLGPLQNNGGPTPTMLPGASDGAVDQVNCPASPGTDQRGVTRAQGPKCDLGAVELRQGSYTLGITVNGNGTVSGGKDACATTTNSCSASYGLGETAPLNVTLQATANAGNTFTGWGGACVGAGPCTVTIDQARNVSANFALTTYPIVASSAPSLGGIVTCLASVSHGGSATCTVGTTRTGFTFLGFTGCDSVSGTTCTLSNVTGPRTVVAQYATITSLSGVTQPPSGTGGGATVSFTGGGASCRIDPANTGFVAATTLPPGKRAPQGALRLRLVGCTPGATVRVTTTWPQPVADFTKRSQGAFLPASHFAISGNTVSFDVTDGGLGDDDGLQNGEIVDPAMPLAAAPVSAQSIPTLSEWGMLLLSALLLLLGWRMGAARINPTPRPRSPGS
jgi:predicted outer membrane repeat protein